MKENNLPKQFDLTKHQMLQDNILVKSINPSDFSSDILIDPAQYEDKSEWGEVISVGSGRTTENGTLIVPQVKKGDIITYGKYSSYKTRIDGIDYLIIRADDCMSRYEK